MNKRIILFLGREEGMHSFDFTVHFNAGTKAGNQVGELCRRIFLFCVQSGADCGV